MENHPKHPLILLLVFCIYFFIGLFVSQFLALAALYPFLGNQVFQLGNIIQNPFSHPEYKYVLLFLQGFTAFCSMIVVSIIFINRYYKNRLTFFLNIPNEILFFATAIIVITSMPANAWIAELNMNMHLPDFMQVFEQWAAAKEEEMKILTEYLTTFENSTQFAVGMIVIALIPAIGEELIFRGLFQNLIKDWLKNPHVAIWISAFIFSAIHLQFFGFFPRMFLGALFGYLYFWTGSMLIPITAHFVNNGFTLFLLHMKNQNQLQIDLETTKDIPIQMVLISSVIFLIALFIFKYMANKKSRRYEP